MVFKKQRPWKSRPSLSAVLFRRNRNLETFSRSSVRGHTYPNMINSHSGQNFSATKLLLTDAGRTVFPAVRAGESHPGWQSRNIRAGPVFTGTGFIVPTTARAVRHQTAPERCLQPVPGRIEESMSAVLLCSPALLGPLTVLRRHGRTSSGSGTWSRTSLQVIREALPLPLSG